MNPCPGGFFSWCFSALGSPFKMLLTDSGSYLDGVPSYTGLSPDPQRPSSAFVLTGGASEKAQHDKGWPEGRLHASVWERFSLSSSGSRTGARERLAVAEQEGHGEVQALQRRRSSLSPLINGALNAA